MSETKKKRNKRKNNKLKKVKKKFQILKNKTLNNHASPINSSSTKCQSSFKMSESFWKNYAQAFNWQQTYFVNYWRSKAISLWNENQNLKLLHNTVKDENFNCGYKINSDPTSPDENYDDTASSDYEFSDEYLNHLKINREHRYNLAKEKERLKKQSNKKLNQIRNNDGQLSSDRLPVDNSSAIRKHYVDIYGVQGLDILAIETGLQLNFNRNVEHHNPNFWPSVHMK